MENNNILDSVLSGLMRRYSERVPDVSYIIEALINNKIISSMDDIQNDHIAFRTMGVKHLGIQSLEKVFLGLGYKKESHYYFKNKKLDAYWYSPPHEKYPRVFISECRVHELSENSQRIIHSYLSQITSDPVDSLNLRDATEIDAFLHSSLWSVPSWEEYSFLRNESEYAAWVLYNRYYLNHFTLSVHALPIKYNTIKKFNEFLENIGIVLNNSNGTIKTSQDGLLIQSATVSKEIDAEFPKRYGSKETHLIAGSYVEFAERKYLPGSEKRRDGFDSGNADTIFESTYRNQTIRSKI